MLQSNQPYQRVDDGIGAGLIGGAVVGGAAVYGTHKAMQMGMTSAMKKGMNSIAGPNLGPAMGPRQNTKGDSAEAKNMRNSVLSDPSLQSRFDDPNIKARQDAGVKAMNDSKWTKNHASLFGGTDTLYKTNLHPAIDGIGKMNRRTAITAGLGVLAGSMMGGFADSVNN